MRAERLREENYSLKEELRLVTALEKKTEAAISETVDELNDVVERQQTDKKRLHEELMIAHR